MAGSARTDPPFLHCPSAEDREALSSEEEEGVEVANKCSTSQGTGPGEPVSLCPIRELQPKCSGSYRGRKGKRGQGDTAEKLHVALSLLYLLNRLCYGDEPFTGNLELIVELDGFFPTLPTLHTAELQPVPGEAEGRQSHRGTKADVKRGASCYLSRSRASS